MIAGNDKLEDKGAASVSGAASRSCLADVLLITRDREWAASVEKMLNDNLYGASVALNSDQVVKRLKDTWHHLVLIDLDSIDLDATHFRFELKCVSFRMTRPPKKIGHAYYKYYVFVRPEKLKAGWDRDRIMNGEL